MLTTRRKAITAALGAAWPLNLQAGPEDLRDLVPSDSALKDPAFISFVAKMKDITSRKDAKSLLALMGPVFRVDFEFWEGAGGIRQAMEAAGSSERTLASNGPDAGTACEAL